MNDELLFPSFNSSEDDAFSRAIDRLADGECSSAEEAALLARLDAVEGGWRDCALALLEARDVRRALSGIDVDSRAAAPLEAARPSVAAGIRSSRRRLVAPWFGAALASLLAFAVGYSVSPAASSGDPSPISDVATTDDPTSKPNEGSSNPASGAERVDANDAAPEIMNVVYRPEGSTQDRSAPLPVYESDEAWARVLEEAVRKSEADLEAKRALLLERGADIERQIVLQPVVADGREMLVPVETFQIVPASLTSYH